MSKIVQAVNAMINNPKLITKVIQGHDELFFLYKNKYKWSMTERDGTHFLWYYPGDETLEELAMFEPQDWGDGIADGIAVVTYRDTEIGTREAKSSFLELYTLLKERLYGVNDALDDIISDDLL